jgi:serine/threonine-protein kinase
MQKRSWMTPAIFVALMAPGLAHADEPSVSRAQALFDEGKALLDADNFSAACPKLAESKDLAPGIGVTLYLANCEDNVGKRASALAHYREAEAMAHARGDARESVAHEYVSKLENQTARIHIHLSPGSKVTVTDNGKAVPINSTRGFPVDPGSHKIRASSEGKAEWSEIVHVPEAVDGVDGMTIELSIPALEDGAGFVSDRSAPSAPVEPSHSSSWSTQKTLAVGVGAVGVVSLGVGAFLGLHAKSLQDESNGPGGGCDASDTCDPHGQDLRMSALSSATASTVLFAVGGAAIVTGVVLYATAPSSHHDIAFAVGPGNATFLGKF